MPDVEVRQMDALWALRGWKETSFHAAFVDFPGKFDTADGTDRFGHDQSSGASDLFRPIGPDEMEETLFHLEYSGALRLGNNYENVETSLVGCMIRYFNPVLEQPTSGWRAVSAQLPGTIGLSPPSSSIRRSSPPQPSRYLRRSVSAGR